MPDQAVQVEQDQKEVKALMDAWCKAVEEKDPQKLVAHYTDDVLLFDAIPPYKLEGPEAIRKSWETCLPYMPNKMKGRHAELKYTIDGDLAVVHGLAYLEPIGEESPCGMSWLRVTICFRRINGEWRSFHEHISLPFDPMESKVVNIKSPGDLGSLQKPEDIE
ncbi:MAG: SgcJ/EcaC family oxidoreductase [Candidatus Sumerlaeia bacterium]|nr:SgcJ/EcaC family oxidoreductase [Candidatus Sumerlaeia bacterium]